MRHMELGLHRDRAAHHESTVQQPASMLGYDQNRTGVDPFARAHKRRTEGLPRQMLREGPFKKGQRSELALAPMAETV